MHTVNWREKAYRMARLARELAEHHGAPRQPPEYIEQTVYREAVAIEWLYERTPAEKAETPMKRFKWTVEIEIDETWVADGFDITDDRLLDIIAHALPYAYGHEFTGKVLSAPKRSEVLRAQGYEKEARDAERSEQ